MSDQILVTVAEAAQILGLATITVRKMCYSGRLTRVYPTGRRSVRLLRAEVLALTQPARENVCSKSP